MPKQQLFSDLSLHFAESERDFAATIKQNVEASAAFIQAHLGLSLPKPTRVYIMTSWPGFYLKSSPFRFITLFLIMLLCLLLAVLGGLTGSAFGYVAFSVLFILILSYLTLFFSLVQSNWKFCAGWLQPYRFIQAIGIKPPRLLEQANREIGKSVNIEGLPLADKIRIYCCHEMTHAFTYRRGQPNWFKEGLAMLVTDRFYGQQTVRMDTLEILAESLQRKVSSSRSAENMILLYARGYWRVRFISETRPELLRPLYSVRQNLAAFERTVASAYGGDSKGFWSMNEIDRLLLERYAPVLLNPA